MARAILYLSTTILREGFLFSISVLVLLQAVIHQVFAALDSMWPAVLEVSIDILPITKAWTLLSVLILLGLSLLWSPIYSSSR